ncbi:unnamed protein product [Darwinula stevensoni]|uniref:Uncharacterized protein n=1 Tax=Darwinula stevensoni TaxID=69355 RepID=A0A7R8X785_9CRUS|nr:unnamed protein product [Darwinula stevensoni]CAG0887671.1 unnamed protein product [Darwinula stevensoni]
MRREDGGHVACEFCRRFPSEAMKLSWAFVFAFSALTSADERVWDGASDSCWFLTEGGTDGQCLAEDCCAGSDWVVGECPSYANDWRCCFSYNQCADECGINVFLCDELHSPSFIGGPVFLRHLIIKLDMHLTPHMLSIGGRGGTKKEGRESRSLALLSPRSCSDSVARDYACRLMVMYEAGRIFLKPNHFNELGNDPYDGASSLSNILDTCQGKQVKRSAYCAEAPGGCTCLRGSMVKALYEYATKFWNENGERLEDLAAGECTRRKLPFLPELVALRWQHVRRFLLHSLVSSICLLFSSMRERRMRSAFAFSWHCEELVEFVRQYPLEELCYPGGPCSGHDTWVHAAFV